MAHAHVHLTPEEALLVQDSFGNVSGRMKIDGSRIFIKLFERYPEYKDFFTDFKSIDNETLKRHPRMESHILRVVTALRLMVDTISDEHAFNKLTRSLCEFHHVRGIRKPVLEHFMASFREYLGFCIKSPVTLKAWDKALQSMLYHLAFDDVHTHLY